MIAKVISVSARAPQETLLSCLRLEASSSAPMVLLIKTGAYVLDVYLESALLLGEEFVPGRSSSSEAATLLIEHGVGVGKENGAVLGERVVAGRNPIKLPCVRGEQNSAPLLCARC